ncbi:MAG: vWA domain-containing protein [Planctomycetota bacterium]
MNVYCIHCGDSFSITKEQLGKRGKCPHCHGTVVLPKSSVQYGYRERDIEPPSRFFENSLSGISAIVIHLLLIGVLALIPWGEFSTGEGGEGDEIMIGQLSREQLVDAPNEKLQPMEFENPNQSDAENVLRKEMFSPSALNPTSANEIEFDIGAISAGAQQSFEIQSTNDSSVLAGGAEEFGKMISRLKKEGLDIVIVFDSTGSMQGEINEVKSKIQRIGDALIRMIPKTRISICTYRDRGDDFVVKGLPLTDNIGAIVAYLNGIGAKGGGDDPEAVHEGLRWAIEENTFRQSARKVILVFGDAPPHVGNEVMCQNYASEFRHRQRGIVSTVTCRSETKLDSFVAIAKLGGGESFLTRNERQIMQQLLVLVFGSQYRGKVLKTFNLEIQE